MNEFMRMRAFDYHWAEAIVDGHKSIEVGSTNAKPGIMAIYATKKQPTKKRQKELTAHFEALFNGGYISYEKLESLTVSLTSATRGYVLGTVEIAYTRKYVSELQFHGSKGMHLAPNEYYKEGHTHLWVLKNPVKFDVPVKLDKWNFGGPWGKIAKNELYSNAISL